VEERIVETASYQAQLSLGYHLLPEYLGLTWSEILQTIERPGLQDFRDPQLFFAAKETKLQFKTSPLRPTLLDAMENFQTYFERIVDLDFVFLDRFYVDVGKEICARVSRLRGQRIGARASKALTACPTACLTACPTSCPTPSSTACPTPPSTDCPTASSTACLTSVIGGWCDGLAPDETSGNT